MKNISDILMRSNLSGKERILMCIHDEIEEMRTGKSHLTKSDITALTSNWHPKNNVEAKEYNNYYHTWDKCMYLGFDMQTVYLTTSKEIGNIDRALIYYVFHDEEKWKDLFGEHFSEEDEVESIKLLLENTGLEYEKLIHQLTFERVDEELKNDLLALDPEVAYSRSYLEEEEQLSEIINGKQRLNQEDKDKLTDLLFNSISWEYISFMQERGIDVAPTLFSGFFAGYTIMEFAFKLGKRLGIQYKEKSELNKKLSQIKNLKQEMYTTIREDVNSDTFLKEFTPLCMSHEHSTFSGTDTKLKHCEVLGKWLKEKNKVKQEIDQLIETNKLNTAERYKELFALKKYYKVITGESIYNFDENYKFADDFRRQISLLKIVGNIAKFIKSKNIDYGYGVILYYKKILRIVGKIIESDLDFLVDKYIVDMDNEITLLNNMCTQIYDKAISLIYNDKNVKYHLELFDEGFRIDTKKIPLTKNKSIEIFEEKLTGIWGKSILG